MFPSTSSNELSTTEPWNELITDLDQQLLQINKIRNDIKLRKQCYSMFQNANNEHTITLTLNLSFYDLYQNSDFAKNNTETDPFDESYLNTNNNHILTSKLSIDEIKYLNSQWKAILEYIQINGNNYNFYDLFPQTAVEWVKDAETNYKLRRKYSRRRTTTTTTGTTKTSTTTGKNRSTKKPTTNTNTLHENTSENEQGINNDVSFPPAIVRGKIDEQDNLDNNDDENDDIKVGINTDNELFSTTAPLLQNTSSNNTEGMKSDDEFTISPNLYDTVLAQEVKEAEEKKRKRKQSSSRRKKGNTASTNTTSASTIDTSSGIETNITSTTIATTPVTSPSLVSSILTEPLVPLDISVSLQDITGIDISSKEAKKLFLLRNDTPLSWRQTNPLSIVLPIVELTPDQIALERQIDRGKDYFMRDMRSGTVPQKIDSTFNFRQQMDLYTNLTYSQISKMEKLLQQRLVTTNDPIFTLPAKNRRIFEVDHIWDIQLIITAMNEVWKHIPDTGFTPFQLRYIRLIFNAEPNLNVTTHFLNMKAKRLLVQRFLDRYYFRNKSTETNNNDDNDSTSFTTPTKASEDNPLNKSSSNLNTSKTKAVRNSTGKTSPARNTKPLITKLMNGKDVCELDTKGYHTKYLLIPFTPPSILFIPTNNMTTTKVQPTQAVAELVETNQPIIDDNSQQSTLSNDSFSSDTNDDSNTDVLSTDEIESCIILDNIRDTMRRVLMTYLKYALLDPQGVWRDFERQSFRYLYEVLIDMCLVLWPEDSVPNTLETLHTSLSSPSVHPKPAADEETKVMDAMDTLTTSVTKLTLVSPKIREENKDNDTEEEKEDEEYITEDENDTFNVTRTYSNHSNNQVQMNENIDYTTADTPKITTPLPNNNNEPNINRRKRTEVPKINLDLLIELRKSYEEIIHHFLQFTQNNANLFTELQNLYMSNSSTSTSTTTTTTTTAIPLNMDNNNVPEETSTNLRTETITNLLKPLSGHDRFFVQNKDYIYLFINEIHKYEQNSLTCKKPTKRNLRELLPIPNEKVRSYKASEILRWLERNKYIVVHYSTEKGNEN